MVDMFKNQLQELAQRSCFNLPAYASIRVGPDHAPRFRASVNFNGEIFECPNYCTTLRQAEHAAAEVALNALSSKGPSRSLTARVLDETGIYKNLLQETAHRAGLNLPAYTIVRSGPGHAPVFTSTVEIAGVTFTGEPAKTKKQAEKNAAIAAWSALKTIPNSGLLGIKEVEAHEDQDQAVFITRLLSNLKSKDEHSKQAVRIDYQKDYNQARRRLFAGHYSNALVSSSSSPSILDHSSKNQSWKLMNPDSGSEGCSCSAQKQNNNKNSVVSLLPQPLPLTVSKILSKPIRSIQMIQEKTKPQLEPEKIKEAVVPSSVLEEHLKDEEEWLGTNSRRIPHQPTSKWKPVNSSVCHPGGFNLRPYKTAPAVQIRSVIPVCSAPPAPMGPANKQEEAPVKSAWTCTSNREVKTIKQSGEGAVSPTDNGHYINF